ncbi:hypothetical protein GQR58_019689 [Nymphon striatum]|nr:hypothetical protein GQR58_019689 [Nymphon striatum]
MTTCTITVILSPIAGYLNDKLQNITTKSLFLRFCEIPGKFVNVRITTHFAVAGHNYLFISIFINDWRFEISGLHEYMLIFGSTMFCIGSLLYGPVPFLGLRPGGLNRPPPRYNQPQKSPA